MRFDFKRDCFVLKIKQNGLAGLVLLPSMIVSPLMAQQTTVDESVAAAVEVDDQVSQELSQKASDLQSRIDRLRQMVQVQELKEEIEQLDLAIKERQGGADYQFEFDGPSPTVSSLDGKYEMQLKALFGADAAYVAGPGETVSASNIRYARLGVAGKAGAGIDYSFIVDMSKETSAIRKATITFDTPINITVGSFKMMPSMDENTSSRHLDFSERYSFTDAFGFTTRRGISFSKTAHDYGVHGGFFAGKSSENNDKEAIVLVGRAYKTIAVNGNTLHIGGSSRWRKAAKAEGLYDYDLRPVTRLNLKALATTEFSDEDLFLGGEFAMLMGPYSLQGEFGQLQTKRVLDVTGVSNPKFQGAGLTLGWFVTGEERKYNIKRGAFHGVKVLEPLDENGWGAFHTLLRWDMLDLNSHEIQGGEQMSLTLGINWYLTDHARIVMNWAQTWVTDSQDFALYGDDGKGRFSTMSIRAMFGF